MKINIKLKDFLDKVALQKNLDTRLKKPVQALAKQVGTALPFCYEAEYFEDGSGFMSIGVAKELQAHFKKQRSKGQGKDEQGKAVKIDKKKVAYGQVKINAEGVYEFLVEGGLMKKPQAKATIKSITYLKKQIGDNFVILTKAVEETVEEPVETTEEQTPSPEGESSNPENTTEETTNTEETTEDTTTSEQETNNTTTEDSNTDKEDKAARLKKALRQKKRTKMKEGMPKLKGALGVASAEKVKASIEKYQTVLAELKTEANKDGEVDKEEQAEIDEMETILADLHAHLERIGDRKITMTPKNRKAVGKKLEEYTAYLDKVKQSLAEVETETA